MKRKIWVLAGGAVLAVAFATGGIVAMSTAKQPTALPTAQVATTAKVERRTLSALVSLNGTLTYKAGPGGSPG